MSSHHEEFVALSTDRASVPDQVPDARRSEDGGMALVKAAVESANDAIIITEALLELPGPRIEYVNGAFTRMTGYGMEEIVGQTPRVLQGPKTEPELIARLRRDLLTSESFHGETVNYRKDGSEYIVEWRITPLRDQEGKLSKWVAIQRDVTDRVRAQEQREQIFNAEHAARLEGERVSRLKDEFLATLSHELRTPLNAILGWTNILGNSEVRTNPDVAQAVEVIERNTRAQVQLVEDLLDMSRIISGKALLEIESTSLAQIISEAVESVHHAANAKGILIAEATDPLAPVIYGDRARLRQVFWNLLSNAIKFTPRGGRIEVRQNAANKSDGEVEISVRDNGQGIASEFLPYIFDRFRQMDSSASRRHSGLGLGLSIVKQLVELHGGTVRVESDGPGKGSIFIVTLPFGKPAEISRPPALTFLNTHFQSSPPPAHGEEGATAIHDGHARGTELAGLRLLVVEDEADQRHLLRRFLEEQGAEVHVAEDAAVGLELLRRMRPQIIISDLGMPGIDGYEFMRRVREMPDDQGGRTPAVALTAFVRSEDRQRALKAGFLTHITKPAEAAELISTVANIAKLAAR